MRHRQHPSHAFDPDAARRALERLEDVREAVEEAAALARRAAEAEEQDDVAETLSALAQIMGDAAGDVGLPRLIRRIDAALAAHTGER